MHKIISIYWRKFQRSSFRDAKNNAKYTLIGHKHKIEGGNHTLLARKELGRLITELSSYLPDEIIFAP